MVCNGCVEPCYGLLPGQNLPYPCPFCEKAYTSWGFRRRHIKGYHTSSPELPCKWCFTILPSHQDWAVSSTSMPPNTCTPSHHILYSLWVRIHGFLKACMYVCMYVCVCVFVEVVFCARRSMSPDDTTLPWVTPVMVCSSWRRPTWCCRLHSPHA